MNITLFIASPGPQVGGMEKQVAVLANALVQIKGLKLSVIGSECYRDLFADSITFLPINLKRSRRNPILLWQLKRLIHEARPDIVHCHGHKATELAAKLKAKFTSIAWLATAHGLKKNNKAFAKMDGVSCVSHGIQRQLGEISAQVIYNGVPLFNGQGRSKQDLCQRYGLDPSKPLLLALGRLVEVKRYDALINAMKGLDANLLLIGDGDQRAHLEAIAPDNVIFAGYQKEGRAWLSAADVMVISSEREGFSLAMIEALQAGVPVLSTRVPGAEDILPASCLIDSPAPEDIRASIADSLNVLEKLDQELHERYQFARSELTLQKSAANTYQFYLAALEKGKA